MKREWLLLNITLPTQPSKARVNVWRKLKAMGAANLGQSAWVLPYSEFHVENFNEIIKYTDENGGKTFMMKTEILKLQDGKEITDYFNADRDEEYKELLDQCNYLLYEIEKETREGNFTFAELEENEPFFERLQTWYKKIESRDFFGSMLREKVIESLKKCKIELDAFIEKVYQYNDDKI